MVRTLFVLTLLAVIVTAAFSNSTQTFRLQLELLENEACSLPPSSCGKSIQSINVIKQKVDSVYSMHPEMIGVLIHVEFPDKAISWSYAVGYDGKNSKEELNPNQPVLIASITKTYIAVTILRLVEMRKVDLLLPIKDLLTPGSQNLLSKAGYDLDSVTILNLLSHTSGIRDYVDEDYFRFIDENKQFTWTREAQIARSSLLGGPLGKPGEIFRYADVNYVLLTEIIEHFTGQSFYTSVRALLGYKQNGLISTWFINLEEKPAESAPLVNQYWSTFSWNIPDLNPSWDLYGGGGIASTILEMASFYQKLFNGKIIRNMDVLQLMYKDVLPDLTTNYCLGVRKIKVDNVVGYNHGGGLGTDVTYFPKLNTTISLAVIDADKRSILLSLRDEILRYLLSQ